MKTKWGQNFLIDKNIAKKIVRFLEIAPEDTIIEIGPGKGILTNIIAEYNCRIIAVEIDEILCTELNKVFKKNKNVQIINADFLKWEFPLQKNKIKFIGNLPFCSATAIIEKVISRNDFDSGVFTLQYEVAERIVSKPGTKSFGAFTLITRYFADSQIKFSISPSCFRPAPEVTSTVIKFIRNTIRENYDETFRKKLFKIIHAGFSHRRKTIVNSLIESKIFPDKYKREYFIDLLERCGIKKTERAENLNLENFICITESLKNILD